MVGAERNFLTSNAIVAREGAALALWQPCELLERRLQLLFDARLRRFYTRLAILLVYERAERQFGNNRVNFVLNIVDERRALFSAHATPLFAHIAR